MKNLSLKLDNEIFEETELLTASLKMKRNKYLNTAISFYNQMQKRKLLTAKLTAESKLVQRESMKILEEFEMMQDEHTAI